MGSDDDFGAGDGGGDTDVEWGAAGRTAALLADQKTAGAAAEGEGLGGGDASSASWGGGSPTATILGVQPPDALGDVAAPTGEEA